MKYCNNCNKIHRNRKDNLCNNCRPKINYPICSSCNIHHIYHNDFTKCRKCFCKDYGVPKTYSFI